MTLTKGQVEDFVFAIGSIAQAISDQLPDEIGQNLKRIADGWESERSAGIEKQLKSIVEFQVHQTDFMADVSKCLNRIASALEKLEGASVNYPVVNLYKPSKTKEFLEKLAREGALPKDDVPVNMLPRLLTSGMITWVRNDTLDVPTHVRLTHYGFAEMQEAKRCSKPPAHLIPVLDAVYAASAQIEPGTLILTIIRTGHDLAFVSNASEAEIKSIVEELSRMVEHAEPLPFNQ